jgi:hypothetical protein
VTNVSTTIAFVSTTVTEKLKSVYKNSQFRGRKSWKISVTVWKYGV